MVDAWCWPWHQATLAASVHLALAVPWVAREGMKPSTNVVCLLFDQYWWGFHVVVWWCLMFDFRNNGPSKSQRSKGAMWRFMWANLRESRKKSLDEGEDPYFFGIKNLACPCSVAPSWSKLFQSCTTNSQKLGLRSQNPTGRYAHWLMHLWQRDGSQRVRRC